MISGYSSGAWLGDFNGDGTPDFAGIGVRRPHGRHDGRAGHLRERERHVRAYRIVGTLPYETNPAVGDFDADGRSDLAGSGLSRATCWAAGPAASSSCGAGRTTSFDSSVVTMDGGHSLRWVVTAELTGDRNPEIVTRLWGEAHFDVLPGLGNRSFGSPIAHSSAGGPTRFAPADFNQDGKQDLAVLYDAGVGILHGNGDGTFQTVSLPGPIRAWGVNGTSRLIVFDGDDNGKPDRRDRCRRRHRAVRQHRQRDLPAVHSHRRRHRAAHQRFANGYAVADFNGDGRADFVAGWGDGKTVVYLGLAAINTSLAVSAPSSIVSQPVTFTATVTPADFAGPVTFYDGLPVLGSASLAESRRSSPRPCWVPARTRSAPRTAGR